MVNKGEARVRVCMRPEGPWEDIGKVMNKREKMRAMQLELTFKASLHNGLPTPSPQVLQPYHNDS